MTANADRTLAEEAAGAAPSPGNDRPVTPHVRAHYEAIRHKEQEVRRLEATYFDFRRAAKNAKENFEAADQELRTLIAEGLDPQGHLPFPAEPQDSEDPDTWRLAPLSELFLPDKLRDKLLSAGVETIGELEDLRAKIADGKAEWPKGIGTAKVTAIEDSVLSWLTDHRDHFREQAAPSEMARAA
jgi:hypothetical protein